MKKKAYNYLKKAGASQRYKGYTYVLEAVNILHNNPMMPMMTVYKCVAEACAESHTKVERGIRYFIECLYEDDTADKNELMKLGCKYGKRNVPYNDDFLHCLTNYLQYEEV